jgi:diadenosine tetraphosphatase ApaH/serine/threonine PP2A family protein phosphatase
MSPSRDYFTELAGTRFASGHTHLPLVWRGGGRLYLNPGSVGQPRDGDPRASFATVDGDVVVLHRVEYDFRAVQRAMAATGLPPYIAESLAFGLRVGGRP